MTQIFLTSGTSWTVPADWNNSNNMIQAIGAGGNGGQGNYLGGYGLGGGGGGGGAYAKVTNKSYSGSVSYQVGVAGGTTGSGTTPTGNSWLASDIIAAGGVTSVQSQSSGAPSYGGAGGTVANSVGDVKYAGGDGAKIGRAHV